MNFKEFLDAAELSENEELLQFLKQCGFHYEDGILYLVGPDSAPAALHGGMEAFMKLVTSWENASGQKASKILVNAGGKEVSLEEYVESAPAPAPKNSLGSFIKTDHSGDVSGDLDYRDILDPDDDGEPFEQGSVTNPAQPEDVDKTLVKGEEIFDFSARDERKPSALAEAAGRTDERPEFNVPASMSKTATILDFIAAPVRALGRAAAAPVTGIKSGVENLQAWRNGRADAYYARAQVSAEKLSKNIDTLLQDEEVAQVMATVQAEGGWRETSVSRFLDILDQKPVLKTCHRMIGDLTREFGNSAGKAISLETDEAKASEAGKHIDAMASALSRKGRDIPVKIIAGQVEETIFSRIEALRERIVQLVAKVTKLVNNLVGRSSTPTA